MKTMNAFGLAIVLFLLILSPLRAKDEPAKAMWVWKPSHVLMEEQREELIDFSIQNGINLLFVGADRTLPDHGDAYADFIEQAHAEGIRVFALSGEAAWALETHHSIVLEHVEAVLDFNASHPSAAFDGIQLDIEPYLLPDFAEQTQLIGSQFLTVLERVTSLIAERGGRLEFNAAIPFWYATGDPPRIVEYQNISKPLSHHILDLVDSVSIMAYRDQAAAQIKLSEADLQYAANVHKKVYIGFETMPPSGEEIPVWITYHAKSTSYMNDQMEAVMQHFATHPSFRGIAIHHYESFKRMQEAEISLLEQKFQELKTAGILTGYADGNAGFGKKATRAEIAAIAARMSGYKEASLFKPERASFLDVKPTHWHYGWVETARQLGMMEGKDKQRFEPNGNITLEEALAVMAKTAAIPPSSGASVPGASPWAQGWIRAMVHRQLIEPRNNYKKEVTREEIIDLVHRTYRYSLNGT